MRVKTQEAKEEYGRQVYCNLAVGADRRLRLVTRGDVDKQAFSFYLKKWAAADQPYKRKMGQYNVQIVVHRLDVDRGHG